MSSAITAVIIDDEPLGAEGVRRICKRSGRVSVVGEACDGATGLALIAELAPQAVFLDIAMPGISGLDVASRLMRTANPPKIVLVTAHDHFATEAFDLAVVDYLLKPLVAERVERAIERLCASVEPEALEPVQELWVPYRGAVRRLSTDAIRRIDAERDYVRLHDDERSYLLRATITDLAARLDPQRFVRVHRSTVLVMERITELRHLGGGAWAAVDDSGEEVPVGRSYLADVRQRLGVRQH